ncbi:MAG TPA: hypothetical protein VMT52_19940, partial [Planctomycetota bacterium]|nr:hypothetical protein [Planctomycetota bacterium]
MIVLAFLLSGLALLLLQLTSAPFHEVSLEDLGLSGAGRVAPDFVFLAVLLAGLHERPRRALWI